MKVRSWRNEHLLYLLAFVVAVLFRLLFLGRWPLADAESAAALRSLDIALGVSTEAGANPGQAVTTKASK